MTSASVAQQLRAQLEQLSSGEQRVARALLADYPRTGLGTAAELAATAGVSAPTVVRFARSLGFDGFVDLQSTLLAELSQRTASPTSRFAEITDSESGFDGGLSTTLTAISTLQGLSRVDLEAAVALLSDATVSVAAFGGRYSGFLARYFTLHMQQVRSGVRSLDPLSVSAGDLLDTSPGDVFLVYDFRRYQRSTINQARRLADAGASIICITDPLLSPIAAFASVVLPVSVSSGNAFDSSAPGFVLTELLIAGVLDKIGDAALTRMQRWDEAAAADIVD